jgi:predicted O-methyltransferase YrrM
MLALMDRATKYWHIPVVGRAKGRVLRRLLNRHRPTRAIELGSLLGYSAILIEAGLGRRVKVIAGDALRVIPLLPGRFDFAFIDAEKADYLDYLRQLEPKLVPGAVVVADNTGIARREVAPYLEYVRDGNRYDSRAYEFDDDAMEVSIFRR